jgi:hypothetical protein
MASYTEPRINSYLLGECVKETRSKFLANQYVSKLFEANISERTFDCVLLTCFCDLLFIIFQSEQKSEKELLLQHRVGKKSKKRQKRLDRALKVLKVGIACISTVQYMSNTIFSIKLMFYEAISGIF